jgi:hypothetical protein
MAFGRFFFSAAPTAQNSPELHFRFINSFIQPSLVGSLILIEILMEIRTANFWMTIIESCVMNEEFSLTNKIALKTPKFHNCPL